MARYVKVLTSDQSTPKVAGVPAEWTDVEDLGLGGGASYLSYVALLTQSGTDAPVATILENTLGVIPAYAYSDMGVYYVTVPDGFEFTKTFVMAGGPDTTSFGTVQALVQSDHTIQIVTTEEGGRIDGLLLRSPIEIRVYP